MHPKLLSMVKAVGIVRFLSILFFLGILGLSYAYLPLKPDLIAGTDTYTVDRGVFFYSVVALFAVVNMLLTVVSKVLWIRFKSEPFLHAWQLALTPIVNIYLTLLVGFVAVINNPTHISASSYGYLNFMGPIMMVTWIIGLVVLLLKLRAAKAN